jgi:hypothetical protein
LSRVSLRGEKPRHRGIEIDEGDVLNLRVAEDFPHRQAVAAAEHEHAARVRQSRERGMHERLVVAVFVARAELQIAIQMEPQIVPAACEDDALIRRGFGKNHSVGEGGTFRPGGDALRANEAGDEQRQHGEAARAERPRPRQVAAQHPEGGEADRAVQDAEEKARADQSEMRHEEQWKEQRREQRADVVQRQHAGDEVLKLQAVAQDPQQQRNLQSDERTDDENDAVKRHAERIDVAEKREEHRRGGAADERDDELDADEDGEQMALDELRQPRAHAHREKIDADNRGELCHRIAQQITGEGARCEFIDEPAGRDREDAREEKEACGAGFHAA